MHAIVCVAADNFSPNKCHRIEGNRPIVSSYYIISIAILTRTQPGWSVCVCCAVQMHASMHHAWVDLQNIPIWRAATFRIQFDGITKFQSKHFVFAIAHCPLPIDYYIVDRLSIDASLLLRPSKIAKRWSWTSASRLLPVCQCSTHRLLSVCECIMCICLCLYVCACVCICRHRASTTARTKHGHNARNNTYQPMHNLQ